MKEVNSQEMFVVLQVVQGVMQVGAEGKEPSKESLPKEIWGNWPEFPSRDDGLRLMKAVLEQVGGFLEAIVGIDKAALHLSCLITCFQNEEAGQEKPWEFAENIVGKEGISAMMSAAVVLEKIISEENTLRETL